MNITQNELNVLEQLIKKINQSSSNEEVNSEMLVMIKNDENVAKLINILAKVRKTNVTRILKSVDSNTSKTVVDSIKSNANYTDYEVLQIFKNSSDSEIITRYGLVDLEHMHLTVLGCKPLSKNKNKRDIVNSIKNYFYRIERAAGFK